MALPSNGSDRGGLVAEPTAVARGPLRRDLDFARSLFVYRSLFDDLASPQLLGLSEQDLITGWSTNGAVTVTYRLFGDQPVDLPLLLPIDRLYWYNTDFFADLFGEGRDLRYYTHAPVTLDPVGGDEDLLAIVAAELERRAVIVTDCYADEESTIEFDDWVPALERRGVTGLTTQLLHGDETDGILNQYIGNLDFANVRRFSTAPSLPQMFRQAGTLGLIQASIDDGVEIVEEIPIDESRRLWEIYEGPFDALSGGQALRAGFDERAFFEAMTNPRVVKVLRRSEGEIIALALFVMDLDECPWLSRAFYEEHHRDAYETGNIMAFTALVTDESRRGSAHGPELVRLFTEVCGMRDTSMVVTFECNDISSQYIPHIVERSVSRATRARMIGLEAPVSRVAFKAISKTR